MNQPELFRTVVGIAQEAVNQVDPAMFDLPTPCAEWNVRQLVNHMAITCRFSAAIMNEQPPTEDRLSDRDVLGADVKASFDASAATAVSAFGGVGAMERVVDAPIGAVPGASWVHFPTWDLYVHTWDLTRATGISMDERPEVTGDILDWARQTFSGARDVDQLGEIIDLPKDASAIDQLVSHFGRNPAAFQG